MITSLLTFILLLIVAFLLGTSAWAGMKAAPWVPTRKKEVERGIRLANLQPGETIIDLGCGDGRILLEATKKHDVQAVGYEISLPNFWWSYLNAFFSQERKRIKIKFGDFFKKDLSSYDVIFCYLLPKSMEKLSRKIEKEGKRGVRVISFAFEVPHLPLTEKSKPSPREISIFVYKKAS